ncbi:MAG: hypothetical protein JWQ03_3252, partial [Variovorax sp.]|nr:hypothetical protein [Variovorax sp.]
WMREGPGPTRAAVAGVPGAPGVGGLLTPVGRLPAGGAVGLGARSVFHLWIRARSGLISFWPGSVAQKAAAARRSSTPQATLIIKGLGDDGRRVGNLLVFVVAGWAGSVRGARAMRSEAVRGAASAAVTVSPREGSWTGMMGCAA